MRDVKSSVARPEKELKAFASVVTKQTRTLTFTLDREALWHFDVTRNTWITEPGDFEILAGASSRDIRSRETFTLAPAPRSRLHAGLTVQKLLDDPDGRAILSKYIGGFLLMADMSMAKDMTLEQIATNHPTFVSPRCSPKLAMIWQRCRADLADGGQWFSARSRSAAPTETEISMKYGYFDDAQREYVITRPDTPLPWINYLGCEEYFGLISNSSGRLFLYKDARLRRLTRYRYNNVRWTWVDAISTCAIMQQAITGRLPGCRPAPSLTSTSAATDRAIRSSHPNLME